jgi:hypothetical protein
VNYWALAGCWISPSYGQVSLGWRFETYKSFISIIFQFFSDCGEPWILNQWMQEHTHIKKKLLKLNAKS